MTVVGLVTAGLIGLGTLLLLSGPKKGTVRRRMAEFVSVPTAIRDASRRPSAQITGKMLEGTESMLRGSGWWQRFRWEMEIAKITMPPEQIIVLTVVGSFLVLLLIKFLFGSLLVGIVFAIAIPLGVRALLKQQLARQRRLFAEQLPDNLQVLASALRAGHSFIGALSVVVILTVWQSVSALGLVSKIFLPAPTDIWSQAQKLAYESDGHSPSERSNARPAATRPRSSTA